MLQARVIGNVTSIVKHESLRGQKMLLVLPVTPDGRADGDPSIVFDYLGAGQGDLVVISSDGLYTGSQIIGTRTTPARWGIVGIVDRKANGQTVSDYQTSSNNAVESAE